MFYLYIRIYSRSQLTQLEPAFMAGLAGQVARINGQRGGLPSEGTEGLFRYAALYRETLVNTIEAAEACRDLLESNKEYLDGYNIVLTKSERKEYDLQKKMEFLVYQLLDDGGIWVDPECVGELETYLSLEKESHLYRMTGRKKSEPTSKERLAVIMGDESAQERILRWLGRDDQMTLVLAGPEGSGKSLNLARALERFFGQEHPSVVHLKLVGDKDFIYDPFIDCLSADEAFVAESEESGLLDDLLGGKIMRRCSDFFSDDFEEAFMDYLEYRRREAERKSRSLFVVIERGDEYSAISRKLLERIFLNEGLRIVLLSDRGRPSYLPEGITPDMHYFTAPGESVLENRLCEAYPGLEWKGEKMDIIRKTEPHDLLSLFYVSWLMAHGTERNGELTPLCQMGEALQKREKRVLRYISLGKGLVNREELTEFLADEIEDASLVSERIDRLISLSFVTETKNGELYSPHDLCIEEETDDARIVRDLVGLTRDKGGRNPFRYFAFLEEHEKMDEALVFLNNIMNWLINNGFRDRADNLIRNPPFFGKDIDGESLDSIQNLLFANRLRLALLAFEGERLDELVSNGLLSQVSERGQFAEEFFLQLSRYYYCQGNTEQAVNYAKNALFMFQKKGSHLGESLANIELAFAFLGQRKVQMGMDYFEIARRISYQIEDYYTLITAHTFGAMTAFLFGNMSKAEDIISTTLELARRNGCRRRIFFLTFLSGRIRFEYGHYKEGAELFEECFRMSGQIGLKEGGEAARRWTGRCLLYLEKRRDAFRWLDSDDTTREGLFFLAEADFMVSLFESALQRLEQAEAIPARTPLSYSEQDNWCDGFMPIEGRLSSGETKEDVLTGQIESLHSHILALTGRHSEANQIFMKRGRQDDYPFKPYSYKYSYIYFTILNVGDIALSGDDNRLAALSRAIERLQSRAGRFDNQHKKLDFLNKNWWNRKIMEEAHRKKFL